MDVDLCGLASTNGWPEEQVRLLRTDRPRIFRHQLHELRRNEKYPTFGISAKVFELLAPLAICVVARYEGTRTALRELYESNSNDSIVVGQTSVPLFCIPNDGRSAPSTEFAIRLGQDARRTMHNHGKH